MPTNYDWRTDSSRLSTTTYEMFRDPVTGDFTTTVQVLETPLYGAAGVVITNATQKLHFAVGNTTGLANAVTLGAIVVDEEDVESFLYMPAPATVILQYIGGVTTLWWSNDEEATWTEWLDPPQITQPNLAGAFIYTSTPGTVQTALVGQPRLLPDELLVSGSLPPPEEQFVSIGGIPSDPPPPVTVSSEAIVHGIVGAQLGDLELDVGKSVRWTQQFCDDIFVVDQGGGEQRYWVINWANTFPSAQWAFTKINFFTDPVAYRKDQFTRSKSFLTMDDNDWVVFVDAHEGLSADTRSRPDDVLISPYKSYIYREIARANTAGRDRIVLPFFVWVREVGPQSVQYDHPYFTKRGQKAEQPASVPYYLPYQGLTRIIKASVLKNPSFNWALIDTPVAIPDAAVKVQIISYGYGHWSIKDVVPPATTVPPLSAANDLGWQQRCRLSRVLPITGLPYGDYNDPVGTWQNPSTDVLGTRGPWCLDLKAVTGAVIPTPPPVLPATTAMLLVPLYDLIVRLNLRDGLWYQDDADPDTALGNVPLHWNEEDQMWEALVDPHQWHNTPTYSTATP